MAADEYAMRERNFRIEKTDFLEKFDGSAAFALHHGVEFEQIDCRVNLDADAGVLRRLFGILEQLWRARIHMAGKQHGGHAAVARAVAGCDDRVGAATRWGGGRARAPARPGR